MFTSQRRSKKIRHNRKFPTRYDTTNSTTTATSTENCSFESHHQRMGTNGLPHHWQCKQEKGEEESQLSGNTWKDGSHRPFFSTFFPFCILHLPSSIFRISFFFFPRCFSTDSPFFLFPKRTMVVVLVADAERKQGGAGSVPCIRCGGTNNITQNNRTRNRKQNQRQHQ